MHPCLSDAVALLNDILKDPGNPPKCVNRAQRAIDEIIRYGNQGGAKVEPVNQDAVEPETKPRKGAQKK